MASSVATQLPPIEACQWREAFKQKIARVPHKVFKRVPYFYAGWRSPAHPIYFDIHGFTSELFTQAMSVYQKRDHLALEKILSTFPTYFPIYISHMGHIMYKGNSLIRMLVEIAHAMHDESFELLIVDAYNNKILPQMKLGFHYISFCALHNIKHIDVTIANQQDQDKLNRCLEIALSCHSLHCLPKLIKDPAQLDKKIFHDWEYPLHQASTQSLKAVKLLCRSITSTRC